MSKHRETAAERLWKEKLELCVTPSEAVLLIAFALAVSAVLLIL